MIRKKVSIPLTTDQLRKKFKSKKMKIVMPKVADNLPLDDAEPDFDNPQFSSVELSGMFCYQDETLVDGTGKEYPSPGGMEFRINWVAPGIGFGEISIKRLTNGVLQFNSENLGREFVKKALCSMIDGAKDRGEKTN